MTIKNYRDLDVWSESRKLVKQVYQLTNGFPQDELYGLTSQSLQRMLHALRNALKAKT